MTASVIETVDTALRAAVPSVVSMPVAADATLQNVLPFRLEGTANHRRFRRSLELQLQPASQHPVELLAMFQGCLVSVFGLSAIEEGGTVRPSAWVGTLRRRTDGSGNTHHVTKRALVIEVSPLAAARQAIDALRASPDSTDGSWLSPLDLPEPNLIVYEGLGLDAWNLTEDPVARISRSFEGLPVGFPNDQELGAGELPTEFSGAVRQAWEALLGDIEQRLESDPTLQATIVGHSDRITELNSSGLSQARADFFKARLLKVAKGRRGDPLSAMESEEIARISGRIQTSGRFDREPRCLPSTASGQPAGGDRAATSPNRRVEIVLGRVPEPKVAPSTVIATTKTGAGLVTIHVTVLDQAGRYLDPLELVRSYDQDRAFVDHPLTARRDPFAPAIASGWVRCVTDFDVFSDGVADAADASFFTFTRLAATPTGDQASVLPQSELDASEDADILWLDVAQVRANVTIARPMSLVGARPSTGGTPPQRAVLTSNPPSIDPGADNSADAGLIAIVTVDHVDGGGAGVRFVGLKFQDGDRRALSVSGTSNLHVCGCLFENNHAGGFLNGGAIALDECDGVLIEDSEFYRNSAHHGGAIFAESCQRIVIAGKKLEPTVQAKFEGHRLGEDEFVGGYVGVFASALLSNYAHGRGGAVAIVASTFRIVNCILGANAAQGVGGAIAVSLPEPDEFEATRALIRTDSVWPASAQNAIEHCVMHANSAVAGGHVAIWGTQGDPEALVVEPRTASAGGGFCAIDRNVMHGGDTPDPVVPNIGGAVLLASGVFLLRRNRISGHNAESRGGGVACVANAYTLLYDNIVDRNVGSYDPPPSMEDVGAFGGGGLYATGFSATDRTLVQLALNRFKLNEAAASGGADGGGVLATCGALVVSGGATALDRNTFSHNTAVSNGGAVSIRNADLEVRSSERFESNKAVSGDGGAIFFAGMSMHASTLGHDLYLESASPEGLSSSLCAARGARLLIDGTPGDLVEFELNEAGRQGAAIALVQEPAPPLVPPTPDALRTTAVNRTVGLLRTAWIRNARFHMNRSHEVTAALPGAVAMSGSTILLQGLDNAWVAEFEGLTITRPSGEVVDAALERNAWIIGSHLDGAAVQVEPLGASELRQLDVTLAQGVGVLAVRSAAVPVAPGDVVVSEITGSPEGDRWQRYAVVDADRAITP